MIMGKTVKAPKLQNMNVYIKTKVLFKFGSLEIVCGNEAQKAIEIATKQIHVKFRRTCMYMLSHM